jgi:tetratricopeptide (TPR) repeat protein
MVRELARQALLIAGRDELGLNTRDGVLREWEPDTNGIPPADALGLPVLQMDMHQKTQDAVVMKIDLSTLGPNSTLLFSDDLSTPRENKSWVSIPLALANIEPLSRGKYLDQLKSLGFKGDIKSKGDKDIPDGVDHLLYQTTLLAPYAALQQVHAAIRESGESPLRLSALVRGYANLGQLTRFQWSSIHKALTARSLLYAQRMVNLDPDSPFAYYNRAYAFALTGLHAAALADLKQARDLEEKLTAAGKPVPPIPRWVELLDPYCKYAVERLALSAPHNDPRAPLVALLVFIDVENCGSESELMRVGHDALDVDANCFRIMDGMMVRAGVISGHELTERATQVMLDTLPDDIKLLPVIPKTTQQALNDARGNNDHIANLTSVTASFVQATEPAEPSFKLAGRILQETNFVHVMRRAVFMADSWGVDCSEYVNQTRPLIAGHPYQAYVESLKIPYGYRGQALKSMEVIDPQWQMYYMLGHLAPLPKTKGHMTGQVGWNRIHRNPDGTAHDVERMLMPTYPKDNNVIKPFAPRVLAISPYCAVAAAAVIRTDFKSAEPHLDEWAQRFADQPAFLSAIAEHWIAVHQPEKAEPALQHLVQIAPDHEFVEQLAKIYLARNDEADWLSTMKLVLAAPDYRLDHSLVEAEIAWHFMHTGQYDIARNYADASMADSGSAWAMECDEYAAEYQGDFDGADKVHHMQAERYGASSWFRWCKRSGHGDVVAAQKMADDWMTSVERHHPKGASVDMADICFLEDRVDDAKAYYEQTMKEQHNCYSALQLAMICIDKKDTAGRDAALKFGVQNCQQSLLLDRYNFRCYVDYAKLMLASPDQVPSEDQVNSLLQNDHPTSRDRTGVLYFYGRQLQLSSDVEGAKKQYHLATKDSISMSSSYLMACDALHRLGEKTPLPPAPAERPD